MVIPCGIDGIEKIDAKQVITIFYWKNFVSQNRKNS